MKKFIYKYLIVFLFFLDIGIGSSDQLRKRSNSLNKINKNKKTRKKINKKDKRKRQLRRGSTVNRAVQSAIHQLVEVNKKKIQTSSGDQKVEKEAIIDLIINSLILLDETERNNLETRKNCIKKIVGLEKMKDIIFYDEQNGNIFKKVNNAVIMNENAVIMSEEEIAALDIDKEIKNRIVKELKITIIKSDQKIAVDTDNNLMITDNQNNSIIILNNNEIEKLIKNTKSIDEFKNAIQKMLSGSIEKINKISIEEIESKAFPILIASQDNLMSVDNDKYLLKIKKFEPIDPLLLLFDSIVLSNPFNDGLIDIIGIIKWIVPEQISIENKKAVCGNITVLNELLESNQSYEKIKKIIEVVFNVFAKEYNSQDLLFDDSEQIRKKEIMNLLEKDENIQKNMKELFNFYQKLSSFQDKLNFILLTIFGAIIYCQKNWSNNIDFCNVFLVFFLEILLKSLEYFKESKSIFEISPLFSNLLNEQLDFKYDDLRKYIYNNKYYYNVSKNGNLNVLFYNNEFISLLGDYVINGFLNQKYNYDSDSSTKITCKNIFNFIYSKTFKAEIEGNNIIEKQKNLKDNINSNYSIGNIQIITNYLDKDNYLKKMIENNNALIYIDGCIELDLKKKDKILSIISKNSLARYSHLGVLLKNKNDKRNKALLPVYTFYFSEHKDNFLKKLLQIKKEKILIQNNNQSQDENQFSTVEIKYEDKILFDALAIIDEWANFAQYNNENDDIIKLLSTIIAQMNLKSFFSKAVEKIKNNPPDKFNNQLVIYKVLLETTEKYIDYLEAILSVINQKRFNIENADIDARKKLKRELIDTYAIPTLATGVIGSAGYALGTDGLKKVGSAIIQGAATTGEYVAEKISEYPKMTLALGALTGIGIWAKSKYDQMVNKTKGVRLNNIDIGNVENQEVAALQLS